jgi:serine/threonine protein kinase
MNSQEFLFLHLAIIYLNVLLVSSSTGDSSLILDWKTRFEIILGIARGLTYLHEESSFRIVHRDIKASNVILDTDLTPKVSDFGLAKLYEEHKSHVSTSRIAGTL